MNSAPPLHRMCPRHQQGVTPGPRSGVIPWDVIFVRPVSGEGIWAGIAVPWRSAFAFSAGSCRLRRLAAAAGSSASGPPAAVTLSAVGPPISVCSWTEQRLKQASVHCGVFNGHLMQKMETLLLSMPVRGHFARRGRKPSLSCAASACSLRGDQEKFLRWESGQALGQAAQGGGGVPVPGGVQTPCGCGIWGQGLAGVGVLGWRLGDLRGLFQP